MWLRRGRSPVQPKPIAADPLSRARWSPLTWVGPRPWMFGGAPPLPRGPSHARCQALVRAPRAAGRRHPSDCYCFLNRKHRWQFCQPQEKHQNNNNLRGLRFKSSIVLIKINRNQIVITLCLCVGRFAMLFAICDLKISINSTRPSPPGGARTRTRRERCRRHTR